jgi:hypothetical protein
MARANPDRDLIALGIQQPWAELILRGVKTVEVRSQSTRLRGPVYLYASKRCAPRRLATPAAKRFGIDLESLPRGLVVGTVEIISASPSEPNDAKAACVPRKYLANCFSWRLANSNRLARPLRATFLPYGVWFYPWKRRRRRHDRTYAGGLADLEGSHRFCAPMH